MENERPSPGGMTGAERLLALATGLASVLVACKAWLLPVPSLSPGRLGRWCLRLAAVSAQDVMFCVVWGVGLALMMAAARRCGRWAERCAWPAAWTLTTLAALYAVAGVPVFLVMKSTLNWSTLAFLDDWDEVGSSLRESVGWGFWCVLPAAPAGAAVVAAAAGSCLRRGWVRLTPTRWAVTVALLAAYVCGAQIWCAAHWQQRSNWQRRVARSPHLEFFGSLVDACRQPSLAELAGETGAEELSDFAPPPNPPPAADLPAARFNNVFLLVLESVGADYLELYGAAHANTPHLQRLAAHSLVFENVYAQCPSSAKAMVAIVTGTYPRIDTHEQTLDTKSLLPSLAEALAGRGCRTAFFSAAKWAWRGGDAFLQREGFGHYHDARHEPGYRAAGDIDDTWIAKEAFRWIDESTEPFFVMAWTFQTHHPYRPSGEPHDYRVGDPELNRYLNAIRDSDALVGRIWSEIERRGLADSTLLVVTGDHGEAFGQHEQRLHIFGLFEENVHVPLVIVHGGGLPAGRCATIGQQIDIAPTVAELCGARGAEGWQGRSLLAADRPPRAYFYTVWDPLILGVRQRHAKYFWQRGGGESLFDLAADPGELTNLAAQYADSAAALRRRVAGLVSFQQRRLAELESAATRKDRF